MINIQSHLDKLEVLKEYMDLFIDGLTGEVVYINWEVFEMLPALTPEKIINIFHETGNLICGSDEPTPEDRKLSFEEYYQLWVLKKLSNEAELKLIQQS